MQYPELKQDTLWQKVWPGLIELTQLYDQKQHYLPYDNVFYPAISECFIYEQCLINEM